jgi:hypothetical protein
LPVAEQQRYYDTYQGASDEFLPDGRPKPGGCSGEARALVYGDIAYKPAWSLSQLESDVDSRLRADSHIKSVYAQWAACLQRAGYPRFADPAEAVGYAEYFHNPVGNKAPRVVPPGGPWPPAEAKRKEVDLAVADATCADETGLRDAVRSAWDKAVEEVVAQHETKIFAWRDELAAALRRAQDALRSQ